MSKFFWLFLARSGHQALVSPILSLKPTVCVCLGTGRSVSAKGEGVSSLSPVPLTASEPRLSTACVATKATGGHRRQGIAESTAMASCVRAQCPGLGRWLGPAAQALT